ncbi:MAG TPA: hypothetical protein P5169_03050 [Kiritimatiellia bacterium]|nr:hypothetical protein [Kiritimatiellia bacterium]
MFSAVWLAQQIQADHDAVNPILQRLNLSGRPVAIADTLRFDNELADARASTTNALRYQGRATVSELRVSCVKCGKPIVYDAETCPFCLEPQPEIVDITKLDTDGDGIPDSMELEWGLDPQNSADAEGDLDGDGFTNLEEFLAGTDPRDPESYPDPIVKLRVAAIRPIPFYLRFVGTQLMPDGSIRIQLNMQTKERTYFAKKGDVILGYKLDAYDPQGSGGETVRMVRQSDNRPVVLIKGRPYTERELKILFVSLLDRTRLPVQQLNSEFTFKDETYKVVDIQRENVVIQSLKNGATNTVPKLSATERNPSAAAATNAPATTGSSVFSGDF